MICYIYIYIYLYQDTLKVLLLYININIQFKENPYSNFVPSHRSSSSFSFFLIQKLNSKIHFLSITGGMQHPYPPNGTESDAEKNSMNKRRRTIFTASQLERLEFEFQQQQYIVGQERRYLARELGLNEIQVKVWFQNRRIKWRKYTHLNDIDQVMLVG